MARFAPKPCGRADESEGFVGSKAVRTSGRERRLCRVKAVRTSGRGRRLCRGRAVFILRPTNVRIWHKAVFKVGPVAGP